MRFVIEKVWNRLAAIDERINTRMTTIDAKVDEKLNFSRFFEEGVKGVARESVDRRLSTRFNLGALRPYDNLSFDSLSRVLSPNQMITYKGFKMQAETARRFQLLEKLIHERFPGRKVIITCTTEGKHLSKAHPEGRAVDFVVEPLTIEESKVIEELARKAGFKPYNEYIHDSPFKTGPHMHVQWGP